MNHALAIRRLRKLVLPRESGHIADAPLATLCAESGALGYALSPELLEAFRSLEAERFAAQARGALRAMAQLKGAHRKHEPFYPGFPDEVMEASEAELYLNALRHYYSGGKWRPYRPTRARQRAWLDRFRRSGAFPDERVGDESAIEPIVLGLATREEFERIFTELVRSRSSPSESDREDMVWFVRQYRDDVRRLLPESVGTKETMAVVAAALLEVAPSPGFELVSREARTATDVLRVAAALSGGDVSLREPARFRSFRRPLRRLLADTLEAAPNLLEDLYRYPEQWKRLGERLHPGELGRSRPRLAAAFSELRSSAPKTTFGSEVERALAGGDTAAALARLSERPGELARRLDVLLRRHADPGEVVRVFSHVADQVSTPVLLQLDAHFDHHAHRAEPVFGSPIRAFFPKGQVAKLWAQPDTRPPLSPDVARSVSVVARETLQRRFAQRPGLGRVFVDPALADYTVPLTARGTSRSFRTVARGSRLPIPDANTIRLFLWWKNGQDRTDIDLSATLFGWDYSYVDVISYYSLTTAGGVHSGDIVDAPQGAAEYVDLDMEKLADRGVRYIAASLSSYTTQPYCDLPECFAGWMARTAPRSGEVFDPRTVVDRIDLTANTSICIPLILDVTARQAVWTDLGLRRHPAYGNNVHNNLAGLAAIVMAMTTLRAPTLSTLFMLHGHARGQLVAHRGDADTVFALSDGVTPFDGELIRADYL